MLNFFRPTVNVHQPFKTPGKFPNWVKTQTPGPWSKETCVLFQKNPQTVVLNWVQTKGECENFRGITSRKKPTLVNGRPPNPQGNLLMFKKEGSNGFGFFPFWDPGLWTLLNCHSVPESGLKKYLGKVFKGPSPIPEIAKKPLKVGIKPWLGIKGNGPEPPRKPVKFPFLWPEDTTHPKKSN